MKVLVLSKWLELLKPAIEATGDEVIQPSELNLYECPIGRWPEETDFVVSFGYPKIIPKEVIDKFSGNLINMHIGLLPYNRGAAPNFWSWFDNTPKGVTIHMIDEGIDTGQQLSSIEVKNFRYSKTLNTTYNDLITYGVGLFNRDWKDYIRPLRPKRHRPLYGGKGSYHKSGEEKVFIDMLPNGLHSNVEEVEFLGMIYRGELCKGR